MACIVHIMMIYGLLGILLKIRTLLFPLRPISEICNKQQQHVAISWDSSGTIGNREQFKVVCCLEEAQRQRGALPGASQAVESEGTVPKATLDSDIICKLRDFPKLSPVSTVH